MRDTPERHADLARAVYGDAPLVEQLLGVQEERADGAHYHLFSEQQLFVLQRLLIESAEDGTVNTAWSPADSSRLNAALFATTSVVGDGAAKVRTAGADLTDWLGFMTQNGAYNAYGPPINGYTRAWRLYVELAESADAQAQPSYCPLDEWHREDLGLSQRELLAVAHAAAANARREGVPDDQRAVAPPMSFYLRETPLADRHEDLTRALSATRTEFAAAFKTSRGNPVRIAWERTPFLAKPFLRLAEEALLLVSPRAAEAFLGDGVHYRLLDAAISRGQRNQFTSFVGWLFEQYILELFEAAYSERRNESGRVLGEQLYRGGRDRTSDVALSLGSDLVLCEVVSRRMPMGVRAEADETELQTYLKRTITEKLAQLDRVITDLQTGDARLPGVEVSDVRRLWPVLVTAGDLVVGEPLSEFVRANCGSYLKQVGVRPLTLLGAHDIEALAGLVESGETIIDLLHEKGRNHGSLSLGRFLYDRGETNPPRLGLLTERWNALIEECEKILVSSE